MAHPTRTLCDKLVDIVGEGWIHSPPDEVKVAYDVPVNTSNVEKFRGRLVCVFPLGATDEAVTRGGVVVPGKVLRKHRVGFLVAEKYSETDTDVVPFDWADERAAFAFDSVAQAVDYPIAGVNLVFSGRSVWCATREEVPLYDPDLLAEFSLFWSKWEATFEEVV